MSRPKRWYDDLSEWSAVNLAAKIKEIEAKKMELYTEYIDEIAYCNMILEKLQNAISNKGLDIYDGT